MNQKLKSTERQSVHMREIVSERLKSVRAGLSLLIAGNGAPFVYLAAEIASGAFDNSSYLVMVSGFATSFGAGLLTSCWAFAMISPIVAVKGGLASMDVKDTRTFVFLATTGWVGFSIPCVITTTTMAGIFLRSLFAY